MCAGLQITGWPAHDSAVSSVLFGPDETSIFSLGSDGKASNNISDSGYGYLVNEVVLYCLSGESRYHSSWKVEILSVNWQDIINNFPKFCSVLGNINTFLFNSVKAKNLTHDRWDLNTTYSLWCLDGSWIF